MRRWLTTYFTPHEGMGPAQRRWYRNQAWALMAGALTHLILLALLAIVGAPLLAWVNLASVTVYVVAARLHRAGRHRASLWIAMVEIMLHAAVAVQQIGWAASFQFGLVLAPLTLATPWFPRRDRVVLLLMMVVELALLTQLGPPAVALSEATLLALSANTVVTGVLVIAWYSGASELNTTRLETELATERAKSEALLKKELGHQVAERSRDLGGLLASAGPLSGAQPLTPGDRIDARYLVIGKLGAGAMGAVYEVERATDAQRLALKIITGQVSPSGAARFAREAEIGARVHHPNLVSIVDVGLARQGGLFLVMELVRGGSLEERRHDFGDPRWALPVLRQVAEGLATLHEAGVVHRDLKPANILLSGAPELPLSRISDFGISRLGAMDDTIDPHAATLAPGASKGNSLTGTGAVMGTPLYMAPEAARGGREVDAPADVFAFGIIAYEMLAGRGPFTVPPVMVVLAGQQVPTPAPLESAGLSRAVADVVMACLSLDAAARPSMREVVSALRAEQSGATQPAS